MLARPVLLMGAQEARLSNEVAEICRFAKADFAGTRTTISENANTIRSMSSVGHFRPRQPVLPAGPLRLRPTSGHSANGLRFMSTRPSLGDLLEEAWSESNCFVRLDLVR